MTIADDKLLPSSTKYMLVRITPGRYVGADLTLSGGVYGMTFSYPIARVERNGATLTKVTTISGNDEWSHDETTGSFSLKLASAPSETTNVVVIFYYLFYATGGGRVASQSPSTTESASNPKRQWLGYILKAPEVTESFRNIIEGVFSVRASSLRLDNSAQEFQAYLTSNDSFYQKAVEIWLVLDGNTQQVFTGRASGLGLTKNEVLVDIDDSFSIIGQPAYMGDSIDEALYTETGFPDVYTPEANIPVPFVFGQNRHQYETHNYTDGDGTGTDTEYNRISGTGASYGYFTTASLNHPECTKAVCVSYSDDYSYTSNRTWGLCRTLGDFKALDFGSPVSSQLQVLNGIAPGTVNSFRKHPADSTTGLNTVNVFQITYPSTPDGNLEVGDSFTDSFPGFNYHYVVTDVGISSTNSIFGYVVDESVAPGPINIPLANLESNQAPALVIFDSKSGQRYFPCYGLDFTYSITTTSGGNKYMDVTFENSFETALDNSERRHPNMTVLHPKNHTVAFRVTQASSANEDRHDKVVQALIEGAGLSIDSTSFDAAGAAFAGRCSFTIPNHDESQVQPYYKYIQDIAASCLSYVRMTAAGTVEYHVLTAPSSGDTQADAILLKDSVSAEVAYRDIVTEIQAENPHLPGINLSETSPSETSNKSRYLHGIDQKETFRHVLQDISGRLATILALKKNRRLIYKFRNASELIDADLGNDLTLTYPIIAGGSGSANLKIVTLEKSEDGINAEAMDLLGL